MNTISNITRRAFAAGGLASAGAAFVPRVATAQSAAPHSLVIADGKAGRAISPHVFGSNEIGAMDGGPLSATLDRAAGVTARRLGGNLMSGYNWTNNATNAGRDYRHSNGAFLLEAMRIPKEQWSRPAVVIETMHEASLSMGAKSLVTLPIGGYAAADFAGTVAEAQAAPSPRFVAVEWRRKAADTGAVSIPRLLEHLVARYGGAGSARGIAAYALDNEPGIWFQNHPRLWPKRISIREFLTRSIEAARVIKSVDPGAQVFGPGSWGATEFVSFQNAPDWSEFRHHGSFLAAYLDAFREASEKAGLRLLDTLDVHWYPYSNKGELFRTGDSRLDNVRLDAPRSLIESGFKEDSWVARALSGGGANALSLPILPSLNRLIERVYPGTKLAVTEFNYGAAGSLVPALALADALGAFCAAGVDFATHWGSLDGWLMQAYRLFRMAEDGGAFAGEYLPLTRPADPAIAAHAARNADRLRVILINRSQRELAVDMARASGGKLTLAGVTGFDAAQQTAGPVSHAGAASSNGWRAILPPRSARRYAFS